MHIVLLLASYHTTLGSRLAGRVTHPPQNSKIAFIDQSPPRHIAAHGDEKRELLDSAEGMEILDQNSVVGFTLWPFLAIFKQSEKIVWTPNILLKPQ